MTRIGLALAAACGATAAAQSPDAQTVLQAATEAVQSVQTVSYDARLEIRGGESWRVVDGRVQLARIDADSASDPVGGRIAVEGEITRSGQANAEAFRATYDGEFMRRVRPQEQVVIEGQPGYGGEGVLEGSFGDLIVRWFLTPDAPAEKAVGTRWLRRESVDGADCDVVEVRVGGGEWTGQWWIGTEDHLPRKMHRQYTSARGTDVEWTLALANLDVNDTIDPKVFRIEPPDGYTVDTVGRRPPRETRIGDPAPEFTVKGPDGKTHHLRDYRGQLVVLEFWASWCPHCNHSMPAMEHLYEKYGDKGVAFLGLNCRDRGDVDPVKYIRDKGFNYFVADGNEAAIWYRVGGLPAYYVIGPDGHLVHRQNGYNAEREQALVEVIERYLNATGSAGAEPADMGQ
jgi:peroxiredoxin